MKAPGRGRCRTHGRADAPTGPWKSRTEREIPTAPTAIIVSMQKEHQRPKNTDRARHHYHLEAEHRILCPAAQRRFAPITMPWSA